jgi:Ca2+-binding EF-hand superfamily protein
LKKMNFLGIERESDEFIAHYDDDMTGRIDAMEFTRELYGISSDADKPVFSDNGLVLLEQVRSKLTETGGASAYFEFSQQLTGMSNDGLATEADLKQCIESYTGGPALSTEELSILFQCYDRKFTGSLKVPRFLLSLIKSTMSYERKIIVRDIFYHFDNSERTGEVRIASLIDKFDPSFHPEVVSNLLSEDAAKEQFLASFAESSNPEGKTTLPEFLNYFKGLGLAIVEDSAFDLMIRNMWTMGVDIVSGDGMFESTLVATPSSPTLRRVRVTHKDGAEEVLEFPDDINMGRLDVYSAKDRVRSRGIDDIAELEL